MKINHKNVAHVNIYTRSYDYGMALGRPVNKDTRNKVIVHTIDNHRYASTKVYTMVVNHLQMQVKCTCGHCCKGRFPESVNAPVSYGPNIMAMTSYLSTYQRP